MKQQIFQLTPSLKIIQSISRKNTTTHISIDKTISNTYSLKPKSQVLGYLVTDKEGNPILLFSLKNIELFREENNAN